jgi:hypothetical protein
LPTPSSSSSPRPVIRLSVDAIPQQRYAFTHTWTRAGHVVLSGRIHLPLRIVNPANKRALTTYGLLDTGADTCLFPASVATFLGHDLMGHGVKSSVTSGIELTRLPTYKHTFRIDLLDKNGASRVWSSGPVLINCVERHCPVILGVAEFLTHFDSVSELYRNGEVLLRW